MRRTGIILAGALVLVADAFVLVMAAVNRSGSPTATIELTELELRLMRPQRESTALFLRLAWEPAWGRHKFEDGPGWFDRAKLEGIGYDCRLSLTDSAAPAHYRAMPAKEVFAVLEYDPASAVELGSDRSSWSRLRAMDAGRDFALLRKAYPDTGRFLIVPSLARLRYEQKWDPNTRRFADGAYLRGVITELLVSAISVPPSERGVLGALGQTSNEHLATQEGRKRGPRYSVVLHYGRNHEPWVGSCRLLAPAQQ
jgi:hypothetical protein